jgi:hypothetical protein
MTAPQVGRYSVLQIVRVDHAINLAEPKGVGVGDLRGEFPFALGTPYSFLIGPDGYPHASQVGGISGTIATRSHCPLDPSRSIAHASLARVASIAC